MVVFRTAPHNPPQIPPSLDESYECGDDRRISGVHGCPGRNWWRKEVLFPIEKVTEVSNKEQSSKKRQRTG